MIKNKKIYFSLILLLALNIMIATITNNYILVFLSVIGIGLIIYQIRVNEDVRIVIIKNSINRKYKKKNLNNYFVVFIEITNLSTYSQYYDINLSDYIITNTYEKLKKKLDNVFLYSNNQLVIINEFDNKVVINQLLRKNEQIAKTNKIINYVSNLKFFLNNDDTYFTATTVCGVGSVGIRDENPNIDNLIKLAHFSMLKAKEQNQEYHIADEQTRIVKEDYEIFNHEITRGLELKEFSPHFLPIIDPKDLSIIGCEALLRWEKDDYRIIEAAKFRTIAHEKNLLGALDEIIIRKSFEAYKKWYDKKLIDDHFILTINLSLMSMIEMDFLSLIKQAKQYSIPIKNIEFDISENDIKDKQILHNIHKLREYGFAVSLDAFSKKSSVIETLVNTRINTIKLDKVKLPKNNSYTNEYHLYESLIQFSKIMGYNVMSKGIENKTHLEIARKLKVDYVQGYYFTPPLNDTKILGFLTKYQNGIPA